MGLDVPMANAFRVDIKQSSENLVGDEFDVEAVQAFLVVLLDEIVQVAVIMGHDNVQVFFVFLVGNIGPQDFHYKVIAEHIYHLNFTILILLVLHYALYRYDLPSLLEPTLEHLSKGPLTDEPYDFDLIDEHTGGSGINTAFSFEIVGKLVGTFIKFLL